MTDFLVLCVLYLSILNTILGYRLFLKCTVVIPLLFCEILIKHLFDKNIVFTLFRITVTHHNHNNRVIPYILIPGNVFSEMVIVLKVLSSLRTLHSFHYVMVLAH